LAPRATSLLRDYLSDVFAQVKEMTARGDSLEQVRRGIRMEKYVSLRQFRSTTTFEDNATSSTSS